MDFEDKSSFFIVIRQIINTNININCLLNCEISHEMENIILPQRKQKKHVYLFGENRISNYGTDIIISAFIFGYR
jgi:hypothetical protein